MAYRNRKLVRNQQELIRFNEYEQAEIEQAVEIKGDEKGPMLREIVMRAVRQIIEQKKAEQRDQEAATRSVVDMMNAPQAMQFGDDSRYSLH